MRKLASIVPLLLFVVAACVTTPKGPEQVVYAAHGNYAAGLTVALQYKNLPTCAPTAPPICKDPKKLKELQDADDEAYKALSTAQAIVRVGPGPQADVAATAAQKAVARFKAVTSTVKVQ